ncbi:type II toxin-antitoxin system PemK/MazF family toxin [bacterium]|jgi:mRNA interferase MazF|nr:type II toxin-antitoxin system PemK/MazF family toxin [bacterium]MBT6832100.1 type II toxin-antitoxin system PemK/MazF family toxin [bacterium]MBT6995881.1 type II toxin-antitoxin system PemK/MazF family toxin [bacterium]MBT7772594.1 type II toxin-antitoxin system PemK/MazF family toxin [bacterium]
MFEFGKIVLIPFPFTDLTSTKIRPALIISAKNETADLIVAFISSHQKSDGLPIKKSAENGLKVDSTIRFNKIATLNKKLILGEIGEISRDFLEKKKKYFFQNFGF